MRDNLTRWRKQQEDEESLELLLHGRQQVQTSDCHSAYYCGRQRRRPFISSSPSFC